MQPEENVPGTRASLPEHETTLTGPHGAQNKGNDLRGYIRAPPEPQAGQHKTDHHRHSIQSRLLLKYVSLYIAWLILSHTFLVLL